MVQIGFCRGCSIMIGDKVECETIDQCSNCNHSLGEDGNLIFGNFDDYDAKALIAASNMEY